MWVTLGDVLRMWSYGYLALSDRTPCWDSVWSDDECPTPGVFKVHQVLEILQAIGPGARMEMLITHNKLVRH